MALEARFWELAGTISGTVPQPLITPATSSCAGVDRASRVGSLVGVVGGRPRGTLCRVSTCGEALTSAIAQSG